MAKMATIEKLFVQIFERKSWIIDKVDQQARLFDQHLASKLLIDGITPPPWLFSHEFRSRASDSSELNAEELISGNFLSRSRPVIPFSFSQHTLNVETVAETRSRGEQNGLCAEECSQNEGLGRAEKASAFASVGVSTMDHCVTSPEDPRDEDPSITSPQDQRDPNILDVNHDLSLSLSRLQRSRSRQKALQIRRSGKKPNFLLDDDGNLSGCSDRFGGSRVPSSQNIQLEALKLENPVDVLNEHHAVEGVKSSSTKSKEKISRMDSGRITRSKSSVKSQSALNVAESCSAVGKDVLIHDVVSLPQESNHENSSLELDSRSRDGDIESKVGEKRKEATRNSADNKRITRSRNNSGVTSTTESSHGVLNFNANQLIITKSVSTSRWPQEEIGRATRSRSKMCQDTSMIEPVPEALHSDKDKDLFTGSLFTTTYTSCSSKRARVKDHQFSSVQDDEEPIVANSTDSSNKGSVAEECVGANRKSEPHSVVQFTSNNLGRRVTRSISAASQKPPEYKMLHSSETTRSMDGMALTVNEAEGNPGRVVEDQSVSSGSSLNDLSAAELEVLASSPLDSSMPMEPRQLNFDVVEPTSVNDISVTAFGNKAEKLSEVKEPLALLEGTGVMGNEESKNCTERLNFHPEVRDDMFPEEACPRDINEADAEAKEAATLVVNDHIDSSAKEADSTAKGTSTVDIEGSENCRESDSLCPEVQDDIMVEHACPSDSFEANTEEKEAATLVLKEHIESAKEAACTEKTILTPLQQDNKCIEGRLPFTGMNMNSEIETDSGRLVGALPPELATKDVELATFINVQSDTRPDHSEEQQTRTSIELSGAVVRDDCVINTNEKSESSSLSLRCDATVVECYHSGQRPDLQTEQAGFSLENSSSSANTPFTFAYEELEASVFPSLVRKTGGDSRLHTMEEKEARETGSTTSVFTGRDWRCSFDYGNLYPLEDKFGIGITESVTGTRTSMQDNKVDLSGTRKSSFDAEATLPELEGFLLQSDDDQQCIVDEEIRINSLNFPKTAIERASALEKLCESACKKTPGSYSSVPQITNKTLHLYQSVPTGLLEGVDAKNKRPIREEFRCDIQGTPNSDSFQYSIIGNDWNIKRPCLSPVQKVWERIILRSASSEKRKSSSLELPSINEESENMEDVVADTFQGRDLDLMDCSVMREPLAGIDENLPVSEAEPFADRFSLNSVSTEFSFSATHDRTKNNLESGKSTKRRYNRNSNKENENPSIGPNAITRGSLQSRFSKPKLSASTLSNKRGPGSNDLELRRNNIVSNITSFVPLVQQKQASTVTAGKRDVKVKALEAAEAARRQAEKKENERRAKKEEMKLERAKQEQENLKQLELQKKKKEEERKKKEAGMAAKKRQREEEERKEKEKKRFRVEETRKQQKEKEQKLRATKEERDKTRIMHKADNSKKIEKEDKNAERIFEAEPTTTCASTSDDRRTVALHQEFEALSSLVNNFKENHLDKPAVTQDLVEMPNQEPSYDISPYKCTDDEDEEDDDDDSDNTRRRKFVPSWANKKSILRAVISQDSRSPWEVFQRNSFCTIAEAALPRRFYKKQ